MSTDFNTQTKTILDSERKLTLASGKVANFAYDSTAYDSDNVAGVDVYNYDEHQNIPLGNPSALNTDGTVLDKGVRSQASSITRMLTNHFFGRTSYNVNKLADHLKNLLTLFIAFLREGDNAWSATTTYEIGDVAYLISTENSKVYKRTFLCLQTNTNLPPVDSDGILINTTYWREIGGNISTLDVKDEAHFSNDVVMDKDLTVKGDLVVEGSTIVTDEQTVSTKSDYVVLRESNPSGLGNGEKSGMVIHNYDSNKNAFIGVGNDGTFRVSDNASETVTSYTNVSKYGENYYTGISQTLAVVVNGATVSQDVDELEDCVNNNALYYHYFNGHWFEVSLVNNALYFDPTTPITDTSLINTLNALTKDSLFYYRAVSILVVSDSQNQPLLTRAEESDLPNGAVLVWDAVNKKAVAGSSANISVARTSTLEIQVSSLVDLYSFTVLFDTDIYDTAPSSGGTGGVTPLAITTSASATPIPVLANLNGTLVSIYAKETGTNVWKYIQAWTTLTFTYLADYDGNGNPAFILEGNPILVSGSSYLYYANGTKIAGTVASGGGEAVSGNAVYNFVPPVATKANHVPTSKPDSTSGAIWVV